MRNPLLLLSTLFILALNACAPDACENVICLNDGVCKTGNCECADGFEGPNCGTEQRQAFVGTYNAQETCNMGNFSYQITVAASSELPTQLTLHNLADLNFDVIGTVNSDTLTILDQTVNGYTVNGTGQLNTGTLTINYTLITAEDQSLSCTLTAIVQE